MTCQNPSVYFSRDLPDRDDNQRLDERTSLPIFTIIFSIPKVIFQDKPCPRLDEPDSKSNSKTNWQLEIETKFLDSQATHEHE